MTTLTVTAAAAAPEVAPPSNPNTRTFVGNDRLFRMELQMARALAGRITPQTTALQRWQEGVRQAVRLVEIAPEAFERLMAEIQPLLQEQQDTPAATPDAPQTQPEILETAPRRAVQGALASLRNASANLPPEDPIVINLVRWRQQAEEALRSSESTPDTFREQRRELRTIINAEGHTQSFLTFLEQYEQAPPAEMAPYFAQFFTAEEQDAFFATLQNEQEQFEELQEIVNAQVAAAQVAIRGARRAHEAVEQLMQPQRLQAVHAQERTRILEIQRDFSTRIIPAIERRNAQLQSTLHTLEATEKRAVEAFERAKEGKEALEVKLVELKDKVEDAKKKQRQEPEEPVQPIELWWILMVIIIGPVIAL